MNQSQRRQYLIAELLSEKPSYGNMRIPKESDAQRQLLRSLMNVRPAAPVSKEFEKIQDEYLKEENTAKGIVTISDMEEYEKGIYIWQGDITRLQVGAIVNAANSGMTGCYQPCHNCIDNCIHTYAGIELRNFCDSMMRELAGQSGGRYEEPTGQARITPAFNLPCDYVIHTVGPIVQGNLTNEHERLLESSYQSCLEVAEKNRIHSIAFCCISTGVFGFPNQRAAEIAVQAVRRFKKEKDSDIKVIFNVFKEKDLAIYEDLLCKR